MAGQPLFYKNVAPLSKERHGKWFLKAGTDYRFAAGTNCVYVAAVEFAPALKEYPIVFGRGDDGEVFPVALLGLKKDQNLYLTEEGYWRAVYIPAYVRRYPFVLAREPKAGSYAVCIDEAYPGFNEKEQGEALFAADGTQAPILEHSVEFLKSYQVEVEQTAKFCKAMDALGLFSPMQANVKMNNGEEFALTGFLVVDKDRLKTLEAERLAELARKDYLELAYAHLFSLSNVNTLIERLPDSRLAEAPGGERPTRKAAAHGTTG